MAVLLTMAAGRPLRRVAQVFGLWYGVLIAVSAVVSPAALRSGSFRAWPIDLLHGGADHQCLMCGLTRSFSAMSHRDYAAAVQFNAAGPTIYIVMLALAVWAVLSVARDAGLFGRTSASPTRVRVRRRAA